MAARSTIAARAVRIGRSAARPDPPPNGTKASNSSSGTVAAMDLMLSGIAFHRRETDSKAVAGAAEFGRGSTALHGMTLVPAAGAFPDFGRMRYKRSRNEGAAELSGFGRVAS